jgi:hypothetical protein
MATLQGCFLCIVRRDCCPFAAKQPAACAYWDNKKRHLQEDFEEGATGLEPGVTGHFSGRDVHDVAHATALLMRFLHGLRIDSAWLSEAGR